MAWVYLGIAIVTELIGTLGLRAISSHISWWAVALITVSYVVSFAAMALALRSLNVGVVYAIWSAAGTAAVAVAGAVLFGDRITWPGVGGMVLIVIGVVVLVGSGSVQHA